MFFTKVYDIYSKDKLISGCYFYRIVLCQVILSLYIPGCDVCTDGGDGNKSESDIYFTAQPLNSKYPSVFAVSIDGTNLREVIKDAIIFSGPSNDGKLVFLRYVAERGNSIFIADLNGKYNKYPLIEDLTFPDMVNNPIISHDGRWIAFIGGSNGLIYRDPTKDINNYISKKMISECQPTFSPVKNWIAIFEKDDDGKLRYSIWDTELKGDTPKFFKELDATEVNLVKPPIINWSENGKYIIYSIRKDTADYIYIDELEGNDDKVIVLDTSSLGAELPSFAPVAMDRISFTSRKGDIWTRNLSSSVPEYKKIVEADLTEVNRFCQWSSNGKYLLYHNYYVYDKGEYTATLMLLSLDVNLNVINQMIVSNYVFRGFLKR